MLLFAEDHTTSTTGLILKTASAIIAWEASEIIAPYATQAIRSLYLDLSLCSDNLPQELPENTSYDDIGEVY